MYIILFLNSIGISKYEKNNGFITLKYPSYMFIPAISCALQNSFFFYNYILYKYEHYNLLEIISVFPDQSVEYLHVDISNVDDKAIKLSDDSDRLLVETGDVVFATVPDQYIQSLASFCDQAGVVFIHCSGATPISVMNHAQSGVFYPLQTFSQVGDVNWSDVPVFWENAQLLALFDSLFLALGVKKSQELSSIDREYLHLAAVFANNYTVAMAGIAHDLLQSRNMKSEWIQPILEKTANNLGLPDPWNALTGPAKRNDQSSIDRHLKLLENQPELRAIYEKMGW